MATNARYSTPSGGLDGRNGGGQAQPRAKPLPHIDDLVAVPKDIDPNQSLRKLLESAESSLRQSEMSRDFNRPALALKDYIRAYIIAVQTIYRHQDYPTLRSQPGDLARLHSSLLKRIDQQSDLYERIKREVIADNKRSGVQPTTRHSTTLPARNGPPVPLAQTRDAGGRPVNGQTSRLSNGTSARSKPVVHPKPPSLHGNAIMPGHIHSNSTSTVTVDLAARFANLRGPQASPGQDPRIKTYPIIPQRPQGPRDMPTSPQKMSINTDSAAVLPKLPDAIYSPARGSVSGEASRLPSSTPRGLFSRTGSSTSLAGTPSLAQSRQNSEYFPPAPTGPPPGVPDKVLDLPEGECLTPEQLFTVTQANASILFIDVRPREDFDEGHIMAASVICVEPSVLTRQNVSASDISDSMVLSPDSEPSLFDKRGSFDLVVFYDQASEGISRSPKSSDEEAIHSLYRALVLLNYGCELKTRPRLLKGGLDAWVDLMGSRSLQSTPHGQSKLGPSKARNGMARRKPSKYIITPLQAEEDIKAWQNNLDKDAVRPAFPRTGDEFLRFPAISIERQSMAPKMAPGEQHARHELTNKFTAPTQLPPPPARPQAAVQRLSHSGLSQGDLDDGGPTGQPRKAAEKLYYTGLNNPQNWCYANSTLQSLLASPEFGRELADRHWERRYKNKVPRKGSETRNQPQLMIQMLSNLFHWMSSGKFETMKAQMLMEYSKHLCRSSPSSPSFGGPLQQDAQEFMSFIMDQLHEETNLLRDRTGTCRQPDTKEQSPLRAAQEYWQSHRQLSDSLVDRYWRGLDVSTVQCQQCQATSYTFSPFEWFSVVLDGRPNLTLTDALQKTMADNELSDFDCDNCRSKGRAVQKMALARMPPLLCISFRRFQYQGNVLAKNNARVSWDFNDFDFSPFFLDPAASAASGGSRTHDDDDDKGFSGPFKYECYAVIVHSGATLNEGHYYAYVRDSNTHGQHNWFQCSDSQVSQVHIGSRRGDDKQQEVFRTGEDNVPYLVFFRRKNA